MVVRGLLGRVRIASVRFRGVGIGMVVRRAVRRIFC